MFNYKLLIEYDGTNFWGWQVQNNLRTVQGELQNAIRTVLKKAIGIQSAGRTDRGVHALGQVANFKCEEKINTNLFRRQMNGLTGVDIVIHDIEEVDKTFHSRFSAKARVYIYRMSLKPVAIGRHYWYYCGNELNVEAMKTASEKLIGAHRFSAFSKKMAGEHHYVCNVSSIEWLDDEDRLSFRICANRFLHSMIRILIGALIQVGRGNWAVQEFNDVFESGIRHHMAFKAPPHGLCLEKVIY